MYSNDVYSIVEKHAAIKQENGKFFVEKLTDRARVLVNGEPITDKTELGHNDRYIVYLLPVPD